TALNGGDFGRNLGNAIANGLLDTTASTSANWIGSNTTGLANAVAHAVAGCMVGAGRAGAGGGTSGGSGCGAGAIGAVVGETVAGWAQNQLVPPDQIANLSQTFAGLAGVLVTGNAAGANIAAQAGLNAAANNRILHPNDRNMAAALASRGPYSEQEILDAIRWSNGRNTDGSVSPATQQAYGMDGASLGAGSPTGTLAGDINYDQGLRVAAQGNTPASSLFQEVLPNAPSRELMNFITANTNGAYQFNTAGMTYGPSLTPDRAQCASAECAAGLAGSQGRGLLPDYMALNSGAHTLGGNAAINLYDGTTFVGGGVNSFASNPGYRLSGSWMSGYIFGVNDAQGTSSFLSGQGTQGGVSIPVLGRFNAVFGFNHSYDGATALEIGVSPPGTLSGYYSPWSYTGEVKK
uniref:polymorphic toxin type 22 domain-containing protein n=1 Tax=Xenophilus azovorans TaxID=151755 RepID=UPI001B8083E4